MHRVSGAYLHPNMTGVTLARVSNDCCVRCNCPPYSRADIIGRARDRGRERISRLLARSQPSLLRGLFMRRFSRLSTALDGAMCRERATASRGGGSRTVAPRYSPTLVCHRRSFSGGTRVPAMRSRSYFLRPHVRSTRGNPTSPPATPRVSPIVSRSSFARNTCRSSILLSFNLVLDPSRILQTREGTRVRFVMYTPDTFRNKRVTRRELHFFVTRERSAIGNYIEM